MSDTESPVDGLGRTKWSKLDIDLQGQNLIDEFGSLWRRLQQLRTKATASLEDLDEIMRGAIGVGRVTEGLKERARYMRRRLMAEQLLLLLDRPSERYETGMAALERLTDTELKRLRDDVENDTAEMLETLKGMLKPETRIELFGK